MNIVSDNSSSATPQLGEISAREIASYEELKASIAKRLKQVSNAVQQIGEDLQFIKRHSLYRAEYSTFAEFVQTEYGKSATWAYQQLEHVRVLGNLENNVDPGLQIPSPRMSHELASLPDEEQSDAWQEASESAESEGRDAPTREHVREVVRKRKQARQTAEHNSRLNEILRPPPGMTRELSCESGTVRIAPHELDGYFYASIDNEEGADGDTRGLNGKHLYIFARNRGLDRELEDADCVDRDCEPWGFNRLLYNSREQYTSEWLEGVSSADQ